MSEFRRVWRVVILCVAAKQYTVTLPYKTVWTSKQLADRYFNSDPLGNFPINPKLLYWLQQLGL